MFMFILFITYVLPLCSTVNKIEFIGLVYLKTINNSLISRDNKKVITDYRSPEL